MVGSYFSTKIPCTNWTVCGRQIDMGLVNKTSDLPSGGLEREDGQGSAESCGLSIYSPRHSFQLLPSLKLRSCTLASCRRDEHEVYATRTRAAGTAREQQVPMACRRIRMESNCKPRRGESRLSFAPCNATLCESMLQQSNGGRS